MPSFSAQSFSAALEAHLPRAFAGKLCVAFSGGVDSSVLLHALAEMRSTHPVWSIRAIHIDHQLQSISSEWVTHCKHIANKLSIELIVERVLVARDDPQGLESAARTARYNALRRELQDGEVLVTAHHADDQAETVLLALMRGSGVQGLAAMPAIKRFARGWHMRPLLTFTRNDLQTWAHERGVLAISDPSNALLRHDRNYLRHQVLPQLQNRWPTTSNNIARSASHLGEALSLLEELAEADLHACAIESCLRIEALRNLTSTRRRNLLRYWLRSRSLPLPSTRKLAGLEHDLLNTDLDRMPCVKWQGAVLRWHRGLLYADQQHGKPNSAEQRNDDVVERARVRDWTCDWDWREVLILPATLGQLSLTPILGPGLAVARLPERLSIRFRSGGEKIRLPGREHRHALRNLLQESHVLPWWRDSLPLIFAGKQLIAVADLYYADDFSAAPGEAALRIAWQGQPEWKAVSETRDTGRETRR